MQVTIDIDSKVLEDLVNEGIKSLTPESIDSITKTAIMEYMCKPEIIKKIFFKEGFYSRDIELTPFAREMVSKAFTAEVIKPYQERIFNEFLLADKSELFSKTVAACISAVLFTSDAQCEIHNTIRQIVQGAIEKK